MGIQWWEVILSGRRMWKILREGLCGNWHMKQALGYSRFGHLEMKGKSSKQGELWE